MDELEDVALCQVWSQTHWHGSGCGVGRAQAVLEMWGWMP